MGKADLPWTFSNAAGRFLRDHPAGQQYLTSVENKHGQGQALTLLAHKLGRAVSALVQRPQAFEVHTVLPNQCAERGSLRRGLCHAGRAASVHAQAHISPGP
jgi:hypothetical protein